MKYFLTFLITGSLLFVGCGQNNSNDISENGEKTETHNSQNSLDWSGTYSGTMPCASCPGIETTLTLSEEETYQLTMVYLEENEPNTVELSGKFSWNEAGNTITLENEEAPNQYFVGENYLAKLDMDGNRVTSELADKYILRKE